MKTKRTWAAILAFGMLCSSDVGCSDSAGTDSLLQKAVNRMNLRKIIRQPEMK